MPSFKPNIINFCFIDNMEKTSNSIDFLDFAYSPIDQNKESKQRIVNPKKKKITTYGTRTIKNENINKEDLTINKIVRRKEHTK